MTARAQLAQLNEVLRSGAFALVGEVPAGGNVIRRACQWLTHLPAAAAVALMLAVPVTATADNGKPSNQPAPKSQPAPAPEKKDNPPAQQGDPL